MTCHRPAAVEHTKGERTAVDKAIFYSHGGSPRAERGLAATVTSRLNGCVYCASSTARRCNHAAAFFSWANRLMLTLGEPVAA
jgi:alkylhydroperoxidase family enzyme